MKDNYNFSQGKRGLVKPIPSNQIKLTILIDEDILEWLEKQIEEAEGGDYFTLINQALRDYKEKQQRITVEKNLEFRNVGVNGINPKREN